MTVKVFQTNVHGKIEFTRCELEKLLNEIYNEGYNAGEKHTKETYWTWTPGIYTTNTLVADKANTSVATLTPTYGSTTACINNSTADCAIANKAEVRNENNLKVEACSTNTPKTYKIEGISGTDLSGLVESILNTTLKAPSCATTSNAFNQLAKELKNLWEF